MAEYEERGRERSRSRDRNDGSAVGGAGVVGGYPQSSGGVAGVGEGAKLFVGNLSYEVWNKIV